MLIRSGSSPRLPSLSWRWRTHVGVGKTFSEKILQFLPITTHVPSVAFNKCHSLKQHADRPSAIRRNYPFARNPTTVLRARCGLSPSNGASHFNARCDPVMRPPAFLQLAMADGLEMGVHLRQGDSLKARNPGYDRICRLS